MHDVVRTLAIFAVLVFIFSSYEIRSSSCEAIEHFMALVKRAANRVNLFNKAVLNIGLKKFSRKQ